MNRSRAGSHLKTLNFPYITKYRNHQLLRNFNDQELHEILFFLCSCTYLSQGHCVPKLQGLGSYVSCIDRR